MNEENDEISQTREAIKNKMRERDCYGARSLIFEAQKAFQELNQASEMLAVCDILCAAELELPGYGIDWYCVLQLFAPATTEAIEAQNRKIVSQLCHIKDEFPGTELALKFVSDAFSVLSDPVKRAEFDSKRNTFQNFSKDSDSPSSSRTKRAAGEVCTENEDVYAKQQQQQKKKICDLEESCIMDQVNASDNHHLQRTLGVSEENSAFQKQPEKEFYDFEKCRKAELFSVGRIWAVYDEDHMPRRYCKVYKIVPERLQFFVTWFKACPQQPHENRWRDAGFPIACGTFGPEANKITPYGPSMFSHTLSNGVTKEPLEIYPKKGEVWAIYKDWDIEWCSNPWMRKRSAFEMVEILADYSKDSGAKVAYLVRVCGFKNVFRRYLKGGIELFFQIPRNKLLMFSHKVPVYRFMVGELGGISNGMLELDPSAIPSNLNQDFTQSIEKLIDCSDEATSITNFINTYMSKMDFCGPSSASRSRKPKLTPKDFAQDQVWAVYSGPDVMPRTYVKINHVVSPTIVSVTVLLPHPILDEEIRWDEEGLPFVCGIFKAGGATSNLEMSNFSHLVECDKSSRRCYYRIFPRKGEIWATYRDWSVNWKSSALCRYHCWVVEVLSDFSEGKGVSVRCLVEVDGFLTFFQREMHKGFHLIRQLSRVELLSFSHQIPAFIVIGIKNPKIPKESLHLEPDALPPKFTS